MASTAEKNRQKPHWRWSLAAVVAPLATSFSSLHGDVLGQHLKALGILLVGGIRTWRTGSGRLQRRQRPGGFGGPLAQTGEIPVQAHKRSGQEKTTPRKKFTTALSLRSLLAAPAIALFLSGIILSLSLFLSRSLSPSLSLSLSLRVCCVLI
jgi:hypothetical protein